MLTCVIADDSSITRDRVSGYLKKAGYDVVAAAKDGKEALAFCERLRPDLVVFDISMPVMGGDVAALKVKAQKLARFIFVASLQMQAATIQPLVDAGCHLIAKPFKYDKFVQAINRGIAEGPNA